MQKEQNIALSSFQNALGDFPPTTFPLAWIHFRFPGQELGEHPPSTPFPPCYVFVHHTVSSLRKDSGVGLTTAGPWSQTGTSICHHNAKYGESSFTSVHNSQQVNATRLLRGGGQTMRDRASKYGLLWPFSFSFCFGAIRFSPVLGWLKWTIWTI